MDPIVGNKGIGYNHSQMHSLSSGGKESSEVVDGFSRGFERSSTLDKAEALKRLAAANGKNEVGRVEGIRAKGVEEFSDLTLNGLGSKEIIYLGV
jgi:hypothetical protein